MLRIAIDTREKAPWCFPPDLAEVHRRTLTTGDYALILKDDRVDAGFAIERKSLPDFVGSILLERFDAEIERMRGFALRVVIVEGEDSRIVQADYNHQMVTPAFVTAQLVRLQWRGVHVMFAATPHRAAQLAWRHLYERDCQLNDPFY